MKSSDFLNFAFPLSHKKSYELELLLAEELHPLLNAGMVPLAAECFINSSPPSEAASSCIQLLRRAGEERFYRCTQYCNVRRVFFPLMQLFAIPLLLGETLGMFPCLSTELFRAMQPGAEV